MDNKYKPLTKTILDEHGNKVVTCVNYGTDKCHSIHKPGIDTCSKCPFFAKILIQLRTFEEVFEEEEE